MYKFYLLKLYDFIFASEYALASSLVSFFILILILIILATKASSI